MGQALYKPPVVPPVLFDPSVVFPDIKSFEEIENEHLNKKICEGLSALSWECLGVNIQGFDQ